MQLYFQMQLNSVQNAEYIKLSVCLTSPEISEIEIKTVEITGNSVIVFRYNAVDSRFILISKDIDILKIEKG